MIGSLLPPKFLAPGNTHIETKVPGMTLTRPSLTSSAPLLVLPQMCTALCVPLFNAQTPVTLPQRRDDEAEGSIGEGIEEDTREAPFVVGR